MSLSSSLFHFPIDSLSSYTLIPDSSVENLLKISSDFNDKIYSWFLKTFLNSSSDLVAFFKTFSKFEYNFQSQTFSSIYLFGITSGSGISGFPLLSVGVIT